MTVRTEKTMSIRLAAIARLILAASPDFAAGKSQSAVASVESLYGPDALGGTARYSPRMQKL
jgi:hypothetical protein